MATLPSLNLNYQDIETLFMEAANGQFNLDKKTESNMRQDSKGKRTQNSGAVDLGLRFSSFSH